MAIKHIAYTSDMTDGKVVIENSMGDKVISDNPQDLLDFLGKNYDGYVNRKVAWNVDIFLSVIFKKLGLDICQRLADIEGGRVVVMKFTDNGIELLEDDDLKTTRELPEGIYRFIYNPKSIAWLSTGGIRYASFFNNTGQYFDSDDDIKDMNYVLEKQNELESAMFALKLNPMHQASPAKLWEETVLKHADFPTIEDIHPNFPESDCNEMLDWCEQSMNRTWEAAMCVGHFNENESFDYDISSAYASALSRLLNYKYADFIKSSELLLDAHCGILKGEITIFDVPISPIVKDYNGHNTYPVKSKWVDVITLPEVRFIKSRGIGDFKIDYGYYWNYKASTKPFGVIVPRYYDMRWQEGLVKKLGKKLLSASWGKFIWRKAGSQINPYYNPIYALQVQTETRLRVADFIYKNGVQKDVIHIGTDGVRLSKKVDVPEKLVLGGWKLNEPMPCVVLSPNCVFTPEKKPNGLYYDDVVELINSKPKGEYYTKTKNRRRTLLEAVMLGDISEVGELREYSRSFHVTASEKDHLSYTFKKYPHNGSDLLTNKYQGEPITV